MFTSVHVRAVRLGRHECSARLLSSLPGWRKSRCLIALMAETVVSIAAADKLPEENSNSVETFLDHIVGIDHG